MKILTPALAVLTASALAFSPLTLPAQDDQSAPPPPMDQGGGAPPPPDQDQSAPPPPDQGGDDSGASFDQFYNGLSNDGQWIQTPDYGYVFQPEVTDPNWAPYTEGHWVYTDYGWTWASDEPWGWATYHYGRWVNLDGTGWVWVPGYQWAPAWVSWRYGGGYCGWAPLPPSTFVGVEFGGAGVNLGFDFHFGGDVDTAYGIGPGYYNFIPEGYIGERSYHGRYMDRGRNFTIINNTRNITNIYVSRNPGAGSFSAVRVQGPGLAQINAVSRTPVQQVRLASTRQAGTARISGGTMAVYAPHINPATLRTTRPASVSRSLNSVQVNRGTNVSQPLQSNARFQAVQPSASVISAAREAQAHAPSSVATANRIKPTARLSAPLTSMQTTAQQPRTFNPSNNGISHPQQASGYNANAVMQQRPQSQQPSFQNQQVQQQQQQREDQVRQQQVQDQQRSQQQVQQQREDQIRQQQAQEQQRSQQQVQQQREDQIRQQQAQEQQRSQQEAQQQREEQLRQQQAQEQQRSQQQAQQEHSFSQQEHNSEQQVQRAPVQQAQQQHNSPQPQQQQQHSQGGGGGGGGNNDKNKNNGQNH